MYCRCSLLRRRWRSASRPAAATTKQRGGSGGRRSEEDLSGTIAIDGSSTVFPFAQAAAELFNEENPDVQDHRRPVRHRRRLREVLRRRDRHLHASRPIEDDEEVPACEKGGVTYGEVQIANDGIAVVDQQEPQGRLPDHRPAQEDLGTRAPRSRTSAEIDPALPDTPLSLYGPGTDSGTFDFFTDEINGEEGVTREDYEASEDDNQLVTGVAGDEGGLGYFGFSYYEAAPDKLNLVGVDERRRLRQAVSETIQDGSLQAALAPAVHVPGREGDRRARGQGVHGLHRGQRGRRSRRRRRSCR